MKAHGYQLVLEVGAEAGHNTAALLELPSISTIHVIDPCMGHAVNLEQRFENNPRIVIHKGLSLEFFPKITKIFDCILLDGDHNWYTVYQELAMIRKHHLLREGGTILLHDAAWPYGRRDMYFLPETIPEAFRLPYAKKGMVKSQSELVEGGVNPHLFNALSEGGPRNGVLTAIEDFLQEHDDEYQFFVTEHEFGLGVLLFRGKWHQRLFFHGWKVYVDLYHMMFIFTARTKCFFQKQFPKSCRFLKRIASRKPM
ncbi:MAG: class I SAM-dependent methyltransferase [Magnetococcus sp. DMHC-1]